MGNQFLADNTDLQFTLEKLDEVQEQLARDLVQYADACAAIEFSRDRSKSALGEAVREAMKDDINCSVSSAEHTARASAWYKSRMKELQQHYQTAEIAKTGFELLRLRLDILRSKLAVIRTQIGLV